MNNWLLRCAGVLVLGSLSACGGTNSDSTATNSTAATSDTAGAPVVALSSSNYSAPPSGVAVVSVQRRGGTDGQASVQFATVDGTATAGADYVRQSGTLTWASGDATPKNISIAVNTVGSGKHFAVALSGATGTASLGTPSAATVSVASVVSVTPTVATNSASTASSATSPAATVSSTTAVTNSTSSAPPTSTLKSPTTSGSTTTGISTASTTTPATTSSLSIKAVGDRLEDGNGKVVQLRGATISGLEGGIIWGAGNGYWSSAGFGGRPDFTKLAAWKMNIVRLPLNEDSWLGKTVKDTLGNSIVLDGPGYQAEVAASVAAANAAGLYVVLDLQWTAPANFAANAQNPMPDADNGVAFWTSVANAFKGNPAVLFELFNEPFLGTTASNGVNPSCFTSLPKGANYYIRNGGAQAFCYQGTATGSNDTLISYSWTQVGYQQLLDAVRATGATNVVIMGGQGYDNDETWWMTNPPTDSLNPSQIAIAYHAYPTTWGYEMTGTSNQYSAAVSQAMLISPGVPVILTEMGGPNGTGADMTWNNNLLSIIDSLGWSVLAWSWNPWGSGNVLISDATTYSPAPGFGVTYHNWVFNHAQ